MSDTQCIACGKARSDLKHRKPLLSHQRICDDCEKKSNFYLASLTPTIDGKTYVLKVRTDGSWEGNVSRDFAIGMVVGAIACTADSDAIGYLYESLAIVRYGPQKG